MPKVHTLTVKVGHFRVTGKKCGHCGAMPTEEDLRQAVRTFRGRNDKCICCRKPFEIALRVSHGRGGPGRRRWRAWELEGESEKVTIWTEAPFGTINDETKAHRKCLKKALPRLSLPRPKKRRR